MSMDNYIAIIKDKKGRFYGYDCSASQNYKSNTDIMKHRSKKFDADTLEEAILKAQECETEYGYVFLNLKPRLGMTKEEVQMYLSERIWEKFSKWICGQTCPVLSNKGEVGYYSHDVERFAKAILEKIPTHFD